MTPGMSRRFRFNLQLPLIYRWDGIVTTVTALNR